MVHSQYGFARSLIAAVVLVGLGGMAQAQTAAPSAAAVATAKELIAVKGSAELFGPVLSGVVDRVKDTFMQMNPNLSKDLNDVAAQLKTELEPRRAALKEEIAKIYASQFTEQELKDALTFYKSPLGQKIVVTEPKVLEASMNYADQWASKLAEEVMKRMRAEMKKKGYDL
jgi:hypothetical protein